jgi:hypothetical protein
VVDAALLKTNNDSESLKDRTSKLAVKLKRLRLWGVMPLSLINVSEEPAASSKIHLTYFLS